MLLTIFELLIKNVDHKILYTFCPKSFFLGDKLYGFHSKVTPNLPGLFSNSLNSSTAQSEVLIGLVMGAL